MFKRIVVLLMVLSLALLPACTMKTPGEMTQGNSVTVTTDEAGNELITYNGTTFSAEAMMRVQNACLEDKELARAYKYEALGKLEGLQQTMALMHADTMDMIKGVWGKEECAPGTNEFDAMVAYYKEQGDLYRTTITTATGAAVGIFKWGAIGYGVGQIAGNMGDGDRVGGDKTTVSAEGDQAITESTFTHSKSESNLRNTQVTGEGEQVINNNEPTVAEGTLEEPAVLTEEWCNSQGMTLRDSQGVCITYADKAAIEAAAAAAE